MGSIELVKKLRQFSALEPSVQTATTKGTVQILKETGKVVHAFSSEEAHPAIINTYKKEINIYMDMCRK
jgi:hypothetical protein